MKNTVKRLLICVMAAVMLLTSTSCGNKAEQKKSALDPKNPTTVTIWNYYNGDQLTAFEKLVEEFNTTIGTEKGIVAVSVSQGDVSTLADALIDSVDGKVGAAEVPSLAAIYSESAYILDKKGALSAFDPYFTDEELGEFIPGFLEEGRFNSNNDLLLLPTSKSTEVFAANTTDWADFEAATGITVDSIKTNEDLVAAAKAYYEWTDSLTPDVPEDGKALYGRDSVANYIYAGANQLGHEMFKVENGEMTIDLDRDTFKTLWDNYYIPYINGYFAAYAKFRSEDAKTGKVLALTSSSSGVSYLPTTVTLDDDSTHDIEMQISNPLKFADLKNDVIVQQGAGYCLMKTSDAEQEGAVEFLKWFTDDERNIDFALMSGYSPVKSSANTEDAITAAYTGDVSNSKDRMKLDSLLISAEEYSNATPYASKPFEGGKEVRAYLGDVLQNVADQDRAAVTAAIASGATRAEATASYSTDEYFDTWFNALVSQVNELCGK